MSGERQSALRPRLKGKAPRTNARAAGTPTATPTTVDPTAVKRLTFKAVTKGGGIDPYHLSVQSEGGKTKSRPPLKDQTITARTGVTRNRKTSATTSLRPSRRIMPRPARNAAPAPRATPPRRAEPP